MFLVVARQSYLYLGFGSTLVHAWLQKSELKLVIMVKLKSAYARRSVALQHRRVSLVQPCATSYER